MTSTSNNNNKASLLERMRQDSQQMNDHFTEKEKALTSTIDLEGASFYAMFLNKYPKAEKAFGQSFEAFILSPDRSSLPSSFEGKDDSYIDQVALNVVVSKKTGEKLGIPTPDKKKTTAKPSATATNGNNNNQQLLLEGATTSATAATTPENHYTFKFPDGQVIVCDEKKIIKMRETCYFSTGDIDTLQTFKAGDIIHIVSVVAQATLPTENYRKFGIFLNAAKLNKCEGVDSSLFYKALAESGSGTIKSSHFEQIQEEGAMIDTNKLSVNEKGELNIPPSTGVTPSTSKLKIMIIDGKNPFNLAFESGSLISPRNVTKEMLFYKNKNQVEVANAALRFNCKQWATPTTDQSYNEAQGFLIDVKFYAEGLSCFHIPLTDALSVQRWKEIGPMVFDGLSCIILGNLDREGSIKYYGGMYGGTDNLFKWANRLNGLCILADFPSHYMEKGIPVTKKYAEKRLNIQPSTTTSTNTTTNTQNNNKPFNGPAIVNLDDPSINLTFKSNIINNPDYEFRVLINYHTTSEQFEMDPPSISKEARGDEFMRFFEQKLTEADKQLPPKDPIYGLIRAIVLPSKYSILFAIHRPKHVSEQERTLKLSKLQEVITGSKKSLVQIGSSSSTANAIAPPSIDNSINEQKTMELSQNNNDNDDELMRIAAEEQEKHEKKRKSQSSSSGGSSSSKKQKDK